MRFGVQRGAILITTLLCIQNGGVAGGQNWNWAVTEGLLKEPVIGLLNLPEIVGDACVVSEASAPLYDGPSRQRPVIGAIELRENCQVVIRRVEDTFQALPTAESDYEIPAAVVYQRSGLWFRIALQQGSAWSLRTNGDDFLPYPELLREHLTYLTEAWDGRLWDAPGANGKARTALSRGKNLANQNIPIDVLGSRLIGKDAWIHVRLLTESCGRNFEGVVSTAGWVPAYSPSGAPSAWFYSRGC